jgi:hypothetical protein
MEALTCPNCGAPIDVAPASQRVVACVFCQRTFERGEWDELRPDAIASAVAPSRRIAPVTLAVLGFVALVGVAFGVYFAARPSSVVPSPVPLASVAPPTMTPASVPAAARAKSRAAANARSDDAGAAPPLDVESGRVALSWGARLVSSTGAAPPAGSPCTLTATVSSRGTATAHQELLVLQCQGKVLYDSSAPLNGMANMSFGLAETPVAGDVLAFVYALRAEDTGSRSAPRAQIAVGTPDGVMEAFRDTLPSFRVRAKIDRLTAVRRGKAITADAVPPFDAVVVRKAKVVAKSGAVPFAASACEMRISPAYQKKHTCRVVLTCAGRAIYGGAEGGFDECQLADRQPVSFVDAYPTPSDGDPQLSADLSADTATLGDTSKTGATYSVTFALSPP